MNLKSLFFVIVALITSLPLTAPVFAAPVPIYVDISATGLNNGNSWTNAYTDLQVALADASLTGDDIWVAQGTYTPGVVRTATFQLIDGVAVYGGFPSGGSTFDDRDWEIYPTVLSGEIGTSAATDNVYHVVTGSSTNSSAVLDGFIISGGWADDSSCSGFGCGGGVYNHIGSPTLRRLLITENHATKGGGMANHVSSSPLLQDVHFSVNAADQNGGGLYNESSSSPKVINSTFQGNTATDGGGMYNYFQCSPPLINVIFSGNQTSNNGGAIYNLDKSDITLDNVVLTGNKATASGGGMYNYVGSDPLLENSIVWGNAAASAPQISFNNVMTASYSILEGGCPPSGAACTNVLNSNPDFVHDPDPGTDGNWGTGDDDYGDLRLEISSPAIDAGDNDLVPLDVHDVDGDANTSEKMPYDLESNPRQVDVTSVADSGHGTAPIVDMGAYETPPDIIYVDLSATPGGKTGLSWSDALLHVQDGLAWGRSGPTQIWVAQGTYKPGTSRMHTFQLLDRVEVYGSFPTGGGDGTFNARQWLYYDTILSGDIGVTGVDTDNSYHVVNASGTDTTAILDGFSIFDGYGDHPSDPQYYRGGGIYNMGGNATLSKLTIGGNFAKYGGGMANRNGNPSLNLVFFLGNHALGGGGMHNRVCNLDLSYVFFDANSVSTDGGGMYNDACQVTLRVGNFKNNQADNGGGVHSEDGSDLSLIEVLFSRNKASSNGGGMSNEDSTVNLVNLEFYGNIAGVSGTGDGGGIYNYTSESHIINTAFSGNQGYSGGGIFNVVESDLSLVNTTFSGNVSLGAYGGAVGIGQSDVTIENSIFWGDTGGEINPVMSTVNIHYSLIQGGCPPSPTTCTHLVTSNPLFLRLPSPGVDGNWGTYDDDYGDLRVGKLSPVVDAGDNSAVFLDIFDLDGDANILERLPWDLDRNFRFVNIPWKVDTGNGTAPIVDIGAYEMQNFLYLPQVFKD